MPYKEIDLSKFTSIGIGPLACVFILEKGEPIPTDRLIIGHGNNILIGPKHPPLIMLGKSYDYIHIEDDKLVIGAATPSGKIVSFCKKHDIAGFEFMMKLPGVLGGMVKMNAGLKSFETFNSLYSVTTSKGTFLKDEIPHSYRHTNIEGVILEASFNISKGYKQSQVELFMKMRDNQPQVKSAGSCFINPKNDFAARLIEEVGLKGKMFGQMSFSKIHSNFLANEDKGSFEDAMRCINEAKKLVKEQFDIDLEVEIVIIN
jgi:UDP-N-acetylmuramate dehydrogenase